MSTLKLGISHCLLGEKVRYDSTHKRNQDIIDSLGQFVEWVPICPEVECGMSTPRAAMQVIELSEGKRLVECLSGVDHTEKMRTWIETRLTACEHEQISGFIFKSRSPSCGLCDVPLSGGAGLFAQAFQEKFPSLPVIDEHGFHDKPTRECFIEQITPQA